MKKNAKLAAYVAINEKGKMKQHRLFRNTYETS